MSEQGRKIVGEAPRRRIVMRAKVEADSWEDLYGHLRSLTTEMATHNYRLSKQSISGGYSSGHIIVIDEDGGMTHDKWASELDAHLESLRSPSSSEGECAQDTVPSSDMGKGE